MKKEEALSILKSCKKEIQHMTDDEYNKRKVGQGIIDKVYKSNMYKDEVIEPFFINENLNYEFSETFQFKFSEKMTMKITISNEDMEDLKFVDIKKNQTPFAA